MKSLYWILIITLVAYQIKIYYHFKLLWHRGLLSKEPTLSILTAMAPFYYDFRRDAKDYIAIKKLIRFTLYIIWIGILFTIMLLSDYLYSQ